MLLISNGYLILKTKTRGSEGVAVEPKEVILKRWETILRKEIEDIKIED